MDERDLVPSPVEEGAFVAKPRFEGGYEPRPEGDELRRRLLWAGIMLAVALTSYFVVAAWASSPATFAGVAAALDEKKLTVTKLMASSTASSAALSALPGDIGTPIAEKLVDLSSDFLVVLAAIYLEKYALAIVGALSFKVLTPIACVCFAIGMLLWGRWTVWRVPINGLGLRLLLFGLAAYAVVPASVGVSNLIERAYEAQIAETIEVAEETAGQIEAAADAEGNASAEAATGGTGEAAASDGAGGEATPWWQNLQQLPETITNLPSTVSETVVELTEEAQRSLNNFMDALAVMIVTSCVIPILVILFFLWLVTTVLGVHAEMPERLLPPRSMARRHRLR